jgi:hypothetical protein
MDILDVGFTIKIIIIIIIAFLLITAADEFLDRLIFKIFGLDRESIWSWLIIVLIATLLLFAALAFLKIEAHEIFGIGEIVDELLTKKMEKFESGKLVHYPISQT